MADELSSSQTLQPESHSQPRSGQSLRQFLKEEFQRRIDRNPRYSLRNFASSLGMNSGTLSQLINGRRVIGPKTFTKICNALSLTNIESLALIESRNGQVTPTLESNMNWMALDLFEVISKWYHFAILELVRLKNFDGSIEQIADRLSIHKVTAEIAVGRLVRLELLEETTKGWQPTKRNLSTLNHDLTTTALKKLQATILQKAIVALDETPLSQRDQTSLTVAINKKDISLFKEKLTSFRREINAMSEQLGAPNEIYHFTIAMYPVSKTTPPPNLPLKGKTIDD